MSDLFDDLEDFGSFDDVVSGDVRDPYPELAKQRQDDPIQRIDMSAMPGEEGKPVFIVYRHEDIQTMLRDNETFSSNGVIQIFGDVLGARRDARHGRTRARQAAVAGDEGVHPEGAGALGGRDRRPHRQRTDRRVRGRRQGATWSRRSPSPIRAGSSPRCSACPRRTSRSSSAGRSRC